jgi:membrane protein implicated in regulation of membrane protease activity
MNHPAGVMHRLREVQMLDRQMFLVLALLLLLFLPAPWNLVVALVGLVLFVVEVGYWQRRMRGRKVQTGVENLVGSTGKVTEALSPLGQIRVLGELWEARSASELEVGTPVRVVAVHDLTLEVEPASGSARSGASTLGSLTVAAVAVIALAGCGGDDSNAAEDYANSVCGVLSNWVADQQATVKSLRDAGLSITAEDLQAAAGDVRDSTQVLVRDVADLDPPDTDAGSQAKSELNSLGTKLREQVNTVEQALSGGGSMLSQVSTVTAAASTAATELQETYDSLKGLDPGGELQEGFEDADDCKTLNDQLDEIRS